jgi:diguanylate cyclase (GGDEF)-like protein
VPVLFSLLYLMCHALAITIFAPQAMIISFVFLVAAPAISAGVCFWRAHKVGYSLTKGWSALGLGILLWAAGMALNMRQEVFLQNLNSTPGDSMLLYVLYGVPLTFAIASTDENIWYVRLIDGVLAAVLGYLYFVHTFSLATAQGATAEGLVNLRMMFDLENIFIVLFSLIRYVTSTVPQKRQFFRVLAIFSLVYLLTAAYINHVQPEDTDFGGLSDLIIDIPFLVLIMAASISAGSTFHIKASRRISLVVHAGSPLVMPVTLLLVSGFVVRSHLALGIAGFVIATLGYGLRSVLIQVRAYEERDRFNELARIDELTGVSNRRQFDETLAAEWRRLRRSGESVAILMLDIDHFKLLNDRHGHQMGDERLRAVARTVAGCRLRSSHLVARYGGEEFAVLLPSISLQGALEVAETMRVAVEALRMEAPGPTGIVTISVGVGFLDRVAESEPAALMSTADEALYQAKHRGRNRVVYRGALDFSDIAGGRNSTR